MKHLRLFVVLLLAYLPAASIAGVLHAGAAKIDITDETGKVNDRLYARALALRNGNIMAVLVSIDAVAIGGIGRIKNDFLPRVRAKLKNELGIAPENTLFNASHCHGLVHSEIEARTIEVVRRAVRSMVPVKVGVGVGRETRIMENRRLILKDGSTVDVRRAYSLPSDKDVVSVGPVDPEIGILRLDRLDGQPLAVVYNFACHPIQNTPEVGNSADITGFSSKIIEENLNCVALFVQGAGGDINPISYKDINHLHSAEPLGLMLGLSTLRAVRGIRTRPNQPLKVLNEKLKLPRADHSKRIASMEVEQIRLADSLKGTFLNLDTFLPLAVKYQLSTNSPSLNSYRYLHELQMKRSDLVRLDEANRRHLKAYMRNIHTMEKITRLNTNLRLLKNHQKTGFDSGNKTIEVEIAGLRVGDFVLTTFPGELTVPVGLNIKKAAKHPHAFIAGYTNGYIYYAPTAEQLKNVGGAQEDSDCLLDPAWQNKYEIKAGEIIRKLMR